MFSIEIVGEFSEWALEGILNISRGSYPPTWTKNDDEEYYAAQLKDRDNINIILKKDSRPIGYLLAMPHNIALRDEELRQADPDMKEDFSRLYVDTMEILPEFQKTLIGGKLFLLMSKALLDEAEKRGINKFSQHARVTSGLSQAFQKLHGDMVTLVRRVENWQFYNGEEPTDYIEGTFLGEGKGILSKQV